MTTHGPPRPTDFQSRYDTARRLAAFEGMAEGAHRSKVRPLYFLVYLALAYVSIIGLNSLVDRTSSNFDQFANVGSRQYLWLYVGAAFVALVAFARFPGRMFRSFGVVLIALLVWSAITITASAVPSTAITELAKQIAFLMGWAGMVVMARDERELINTTKAVFILLISADVLAVALVPSLAIHQGYDILEGNLAGSWRGLHEHKGKFGELLAITSVLLYAEWRNSRKLWLIAGAAVCYLLTFAAGSKVAMAGVLIALSLFELFLFIAVYASGVRATMVLLPFAVAAALVMGVFVPIILEQTVGDATFSGRTLVWDFLWKYSLSHPWLGSGFSSFFIGEDGPLYQQGGTQFLQHIGNAHNTFYDMLVAIGWPGLILAVATFFVLPITQNFRRMKDEPNVRVWIAGILFLLINGCTAVVMFQPQRTGGLMVILSYFALRHFGQRGRSEARAGADASEIYKVSAER